MNIEISSLMRTDIEMLHAVYGGYVTPTEAAYYYGCSRTTVHEAIKKDKILTYELTSGRVVIPYAELHQWRPARK